MSSSMARRASWCPSATSATFADRLTTLACDPGTRARMGAAAPEHARAFDGDRLVADLDRLYRRTLHERCGAMNRRCRSDWPASPRSSRPSILVRLVIAVAGRIGCDRQSQRSTAGATGASRRSAGSASSARSPSAASSSPARTSRSRRSWPAAVGGVRARPGRRPRIRLATTPGGRPGRHRPRRSGSIVGPTWAASAMVVMGAARRRRRRRAGQLHQPRRQRRRPRRQPVDGLRR